jgi:DNA-binding transcriptional MerR regulator
MDMAVFEEKMNAYNFRDHQRFQTYLRTLKQHGLTIEDTTEYVKHKREELVELERASWLDGTSGTSGNSGTEGTSGTSGSSGNLEHLVQQF